MTSLEALTLTVPALACVQLACVSTQRTLGGFALSALFWVSASVLLAALAPTITYYEYGPLNAAGIRTLPFVDASVLAVVSVYLASALGVFRKYDIPPVACVVTLTALSESWVS